MVYFSIIEGGIILDYVYVLNGVWVDVKKILIYYSYYYGLCVFIFIN